MFTCMCGWGTECMCVHMYVEAKDEFQESFLKRYFSCLFEIESLIDLELTHYAPLSSQQALSLPPQHWAYRYISPCPIFYVDIGDLTWVLMLT